MSHSRRVFKRLCASLSAALGLLAFLAVGAQAVTWDVEGKEIGANVTFTSKLVSGTTMLLLVPAQNLVIHCTGMNTEEGTLRTDNTGHGLYIFFGCTTKVKGAESGGCKPEILVWRVKYLPILHAGKVYLLLESLTSGQPISTIHYNEETCALPPLPTVTGHVVFECIPLFGGVPLTCSHWAIIHRLKPAPKALFGGTLSYGLNEATLEADIEMSLTGANAGKTFGALV